MVVDFFFKLNLLPPYSLRLQGIKFSFTAIQHRGGKTLNNRASNLGVLSVKITNLKRHIAHILPVRPTVPPFPKIPAYVGHPYKLTSWWPSKCASDVGHVGDDCLDPVSLALHLGNQPRHLVPRRVRFI